MSKRQWLCVMGVWVMFCLFLGFPVAWHKIISLISGFVIIAIAYNLPHEQKLVPRGTESAFVESENKDIVQNQ